MTPVPPARRATQAQRRLTPDGLAARLDQNGRMTLRHAGRMHHLGTGAAHTRKRVLALADDHQVTVTDITTGEVLSVHRIDPHKSYWRNRNKEPGRWPSPH